MIQKRIIELLEEKKLKRSELVFTLSNILNICRRSVYKRLNEEILFSIKELEIIVIYFKINPNELFVNFNNTSSEKLRSNNIKEFIISTIKLWEDKVNLLSYKDNPQIFVTTNSLPFLLTFNFPNLVKFKLYSLAWDNWESKTEIFPPLHLGGEIFADVNEYCSKIFNIYKKTPATEIWGFNTFQMCLSQIDYFYQNKMIFEPDIKILMSDIRRLLKISNHYAKNGRKEQATQTRLQTLSSNYTLLINKIMNVKEYTFFSWRENDKIGSFIYNPIYGQISDKTKMENVEKYIIQLRKTSTQISVMNSKTRMSYFEKVRRSIQKYEQNIQKGLVEIKDARDSI